MTLDLLLAAAWQPDIAGPPETTTVGLRRASAVLTVLPAILLYFLYRAFPKPYIPAWIAMWLGLALPLFVGSIGVQGMDLSVESGRLIRHNIARIGVAISALTWLGGMTLLWLSAGWFRAPVRWPRWLFPAGLVTSAIFLIGSVTIGLVVVIRGGLFLGTALFILGAIAFLRLARRERLVGALIIGAVLAIEPVDMVMNGLTALTRVSGPIAAWGWTLLYGLLVLGMFMLVFEDVTWELRQRNVQLRAAQAELKSRVVTDALTGCFNRRFFDEITAHELKRHQRYGLPLSLLFFDCDRFKQINDTRGHDGGDRVLAAIGRVIRGRVRGTDYVFRWGGDEFLAVVTCDEPMAEAKAREITEAFAAEPLLLEMPPGTGLSVGYVTVPPDATELFSFVQMADRRMYAMKKKPA